VSALKVGSSSQHCKNGPADLFPSVEAAILPSNNTSDDSTAAAVEMRGFSLWSETRVHDVFGELKDSFR